MTAGNVDVHCTAVSGFIAVLAAVDLNIMLQLDPKNLT